MNSLHIYLIAIIVISFSQNTFSISKSYDENILATLYNDKPCFYLENNKFNKNKKDYSEFSIEVYENKYNIESIFFSRKKIKTPKTISSCANISDFSEKPLLDFWQEDMPYSIILEDGTTYYKEFCFNKNGLFKVKHIPDPNHIKNAKRECTNVDI